ncbi:MAG: hypothetical protein FWE97_04700 [Dehalococcoidia bacterium]|nr:hypothetical protein [Dehalococcoidia bacterium]
MKDTVAQKFDAIAIKYGIMRLYFYNNAADVITECETQQIKVLGINSFKLSARGIQPFMEYSPDYSKLEKHQTWGKAREDIFNYSEMDLVFEVVY